METVNKCVVTFYFDDGRSIDKEYIYGCSFRGITLDGSRPIGFHIEFDSDTHIDNNDLADIYHKRIKPALKVGVDARITSNLDTINHKELFNGIN
jgi:hypothetical protein